MLTVQRVLVLLGPSYRNRYIGNMCTFPLIIKRSVFFIDIRIASFVVIIYISKIIIINFV